ncbi:MAG: IclR family transcriptional regulator [Oscillospiraceae bacterium]
MYLADSLNKDSGNKSVSKTLTILSTFDEMTPIQRTSDIAAKLNMHISTVSRHLNTLLDWGFLERDDATGFYYPGFKIVALAGAALQNNDAFRYAHAELPKLSSKYNIHSHMGIPRQGDIIHLIDSCCENTIDLLMPMGHRHPMYCCAMGRAILAFLPKSEMNDILKNSDRCKHAPATKTDIDEIVQDLVRVKRRGYSVVVNELNEGVGSLAAPVFDRNHTPIAAISVSASAHSFSRLDREQELAKAVMGAAGKISSKLGYYPR